MTDPISLFTSASQWTTESITEPSIKDGQIHSLAMMLRGIVVDIITNNDDLVGVVDRNRYSIDSHNIWTCGVVSSTDRDDLENILGVMKRIMAEHRRTSTENHYEWQGGEYARFNNIRHEFHFALIQKKSAIAEW